MKNYSYWGVTITHHLHRMIITPPIGVILPLISPFFWYLRLPILCNHIKSLLIQFVWLFITLKLAGLRDWFYWFTFVKDFPFVSNLYSLACTSLKLVVFSNMYCHCVCFTMYWSLWIFAYLSVIFYINITLTLALALANWISIFRLLVGFRIAAVCYIF